MDDPRTTNPAELLEFGDAFFEMDRAWRIVRVNRRQEELSRIPRSESVGRTFAQVWPELATPQSRYWREYQRCMDQRVPVQFEEYYAPLELWTDVTAYPVSTGGIAVFFRDSTERKLAAEELRLSRSRLEAERTLLQTVFDTLPVGLFTVDGRGTVMMVNDELERIWGGHPPVDAVLDYGKAKGFRSDTGERLAPSDWPCAQALRGKRTEGLMIDIERHDGTRATILVSSSPMHDDAGHIAAAVTVHQDVSELRAAQERIQEADRRKDDFLGMLSHELRNPLAPIRNALYILDHAEPTGQQARRAKDVANRQVAHLTRLVDDLLDVTRIARGKVELRRVAVDVCVLTRRTAEDYRALMHERRIEFTVTTPDDVLLVDGDETRLAQVLGNLLVNAAKFTPAGGRVAVAVERSGAMAAIRVRDTGAGIPGEVLPTIFEPFTQAEQTLARSEGGLGLGLALVKGFVALHGGHVEVSSAGSGHGAEFVVELPLAAPSIAGHARAAAIPLPPEPDRPRRVLVVDDNRDAAESLAELARMLGHEVEIAFDAFDALAKVAVAPPDIVLCDIGLPGMDGYEFARQFRALTSRRRIRLVALSGYATPEDVARADSAGFDEHIAKPASPERIEQTLAA